MLKTRIHFIVNPIAGTGKHKINKKFLNTFLNNNLFDITVKFSEYHRHAIILTQESLLEKPPIIVACGGDGTINEVASCLVNTQVKLGILPIGSGNGLALNLAIPKNIPKALQVIKKANFIKIDTGTINNYFFFSNIGVGFSAQVIYNFEKKKKRKRKGYVSAIYKSLKTYDYSNTFEVSYNYKTEIITPFLLFVSNSNQMGFNMSLTPRASLQDGELDILMVKKLSILKMVIFTFLFFFKKHYWLKEVQMISSNFITIAHQLGEDLSVQKDGEYLNMKENILEIKLLEKSLKVCV